MNVSELTGSWTKMSAKGSDPADHPSCDKTTGKPPSATPTTPRRTGGGNFTEAASGWQKPTTTSNAAMTSRTKAVSNIGVEICWTQEAGGPDTPASYSPSASQDTDTGKLPGEVSS